jgi:hypothetical protein
VPQGVPDGVVIVYEDMHRGACKQADDDFRSSFSIRNDTVEIDSNSASALVSG